MDKRLSIALLLTAIIVAVTPILFPTPRKPTTAAAPKVATTTSAATSQPQPVPATTSPAGTVTSPTVRADSNTAPLSSPAMSPASTLAAEVTTIETPKAIYKFSNVGAAPVSATLREYKNLSPTGGLVDLRSMNQSLLRYALVLNRDTIQLSAMPFQASESKSANGHQVLTYRANVQNANVAISYEIVPDKYVLKVAGRLDGAIAGQPFLLIQLPSSLPPQEKDTLVDLRALSYSFKPQHDHARGVPFGKLDPGERKLEAGPLTWAAVRNKYFVIGLVNPTGSAFEEMTLVGGPRTSKVATSGSATAVKAVKNGTFAFDMYIGPQQSTQLLEMGRDFDHVNPYGWSILQPVVNPIAALCLKLLLWVHDNLKLSYGWVLVLFGVFIRLALWPLNQSAMRSSMKMQELQPKLAEVQSKYKDKPERQREEMMRVYKEAGASPFTALSGCLPMLIPMPVLFALFFVFQNTIEFRGVPFLWLTDISIHDPLYILPVLMGISMYVLSWIGLRNAPPNPQAKMMSYMFPVMMTFVLANMASGLNLYYTAQNIAALPQQWLLARERQKARKTG